MYLFSLEKQKIDEGSLMSAKFGSPTTVFPMRDMKGNETQQQQLISPQISARKDEDYLWTCEADWFWRASLIGWSMSSQSQFELFSV